MILIPASALKIILIGIVSSSVTSIPRTPEIKPIIRVSAVNTRLISFLLAPTLLRIPISLILSSTEMYVIIPINLLCLYIISHEEQNAKDFREKIVFFLNFFDVVQRLSEK